MTTFSPLVDYPTFLLIGAQKCGTTWLSSMISQHSDVAVGVKKELHFFDRNDNYLKGFDWYRSQFRVEPHSRAVGEFTPDYFWTADYDQDDRPCGRNRVVPELVQPKLPQLRLIVCLRDPVERAVSAYYHHMKKRRVSPRQPLIDVADRYGIQSIGYYDVYLSHWLEHYPSESILILIYEDDLNDQNKPETLRKVFRHIGVDDTFRPDHLFSRFNIRRSYFEIRRERLPYVLRRALRRLPSRVKESEIWDIPVREDEKRRLAEIYQPHTERLETMIGRKLPWRRPDQDALQEAGDPNCRAGR